MFTLINLFVCCMYGTFQIAVSIYEPQGISYVDAYGTFLSNELLPLVEKTVTDKKVLHTLSTEDKKKNRYRRETGVRVRLNTQHQSVSSEKRFMKLTGTKMSKWWANMTLQYPSVRHTSLSRRQLNSREGVPAVMEQWLMEILSSSTMWTVRPVRVTFRFVFGFFM